MMKFRNYKIFGFVLFKHGFFILLMLILFCNAKAQDRIELGLIGGVSYYIGDLNPNKQLYKPGPAFGGIARYILTDRLAVKGSAMIMNISGDYSANEVNYPNVGGGYSFKRNLGDASLQMEFNFKSYDHPFIGTTVFTPYVTFGLGTTVYKRFSSENENNSERTVFILSLPIGIGVKYKLNKWIRVGAEWSFRKTFVDDLDYRDRRYIPFVSSEDPYGFEGGTKIHNNDLYSFVGVMVTFSMFSRRTDCYSGY